MKVKELIKKLQKCDPEESIIIIGQESLECIDGYWDDKNFKVRGEATGLFSVDEYSHEIHLLATPNPRDFIL